MKALGVAAMLAGPLTGCTPAFAGNEFSVAAGKMLNNTNVAVPGWVAGVEYAHTKMLWDVSVRARFMKAGRSHLSEWGNSTFESLAIAKDFGGWTAGVGSVVYMNYDVRVQWQGRLYQNDNKHFSKHCWQCGQIATLEYHFAKTRFSAELQYYRVPDMVPTYNGTILLLKYDLYRSNP